MAFTHPSSPSSTPPVSVKSPAADLPWEPLRPPKRRHPLTSFLAALLTSLALYIFIQGASDWDALVELAVKVWGHHASKRRFEAVMRPTHNFETLHGYLRATPTPTAPSPPLDGYCGFCYGGDPPESGCCNTCEEVRQAYDQRVWVFLPETVAQCAASSGAGQAASEASQAIPSVGLAQMLPPLAGDW